MAQIITRFALNKTFMKKLKNQFGKYQSFNFAELKEVLHEEWSKISVTHKANIILHEMFGGSLD